MNSVPTYRNIVGKMLQNPETVENIITAASDLHNDPVAVGLMFKPETSR